MVNIHMKNVQNNYNSYMHLVAKLFFFSKTIQQFFRRLVSLSYFYRCVYNKPRTISLQFTCLAIKHIEGRSTSS